MMSHVSCNHQYSAMVYLKIKVGMEWVSEFEALHIITLYPLHSTPIIPPNFTALHAPTTIQPHYSTVFHCTAPPHLLLFDIML